MSHRSAFDDDTLASLAPGGMLRGGVVQAPQAGVFFVGVGAGGEPAGVTVDLLRGLGERAGLPIAFSVYPNSGECTDALAQGAIDVAFMPVDAVRRAKVSFGPAYYLLRSTLLIAASAGCRRLGEYAERGRCFVGIAGTTTLRAAIRTFGADRARESPDVAGAVRMFSEGEADAIALSEDYLKELAPRFPGSVVMEDAFQETSISVAVPRERPLALAAVSRYIEEAKASGLVRSVFDNNGLAGEDVAPPENTTTETAR